MPDKILRVKHLKAVRQLRAGTALDAVCKAMRLHPAGIKDLEVEYRNVPDDILARLEQALSANEKLRRLVASLGNPVRADDWEMNPDQ